MANIFWKFTDGDGNAFTVEPVGNPQNQSVPVVYKGEQLCITGFVEERFTLSIPDELAERYERREVKIRPQWMISYLPNEPDKSPIFNILRIEFVDA